MVLRKGYANQYFIDKLNPKYWDERYFCRKNFSSPQQTEDDAKDTLLSQIKQNFHEQETKRENENFNSPNSSLLDKMFLKKRGDNKNIEDLILKQRLHGVVPKVSVQDSLFENLKFSENTFCDRFLKKIKNK